jgi:Pyridoxamine 5'-phosphate oxidase
MTHTLSADLTTDQIWRELTHQSFAVLSHVTPDGEPRSSGVVYTVVGRRLLITTATHSWKARQIPADARVAVTVPVRRGGILPLMFPIPPATISFHGTAAVLAPDSPEGMRAMAALAPLIPPDRRAACRVIEVQPAGQFLTYGIGVPLARMRQPELARGHAPVS